MEKSKWKVTWQFIGGVKMYAVYRLRDIHSVDCSSNREYGSGYSCREEEVSALAERLNELEDKAGA